MSCQSVKLSVINILEGLSIKINKVIAVKH